MSHPGIQATQRLVTSSYVLAQYQCRCPQIGQSLIQCQHQRCTGTLLHPQDTFPRRTLSLTWSIMILLDPFLQQKTTCIYSLVFIGLPSVIPLPGTSTESIVQAFHGLDSSIIRCSYNPHVRSGGGGGQLSGEVKCLPPHDKPFHVLRQDDKFYRLHKNGLSSSVSLDHPKPAIQKSCTSQLMQCKSHHNHRPAPAATAHHQWFRRPVLVNVSISQIV